MPANEIEKPAGTEPQELVIIGGGPAGLSAALVMARAHRRVTLVDGGTPRNAKAPAIHTFVTRDGTLPAEFRRIAREQLAVYPTVAFHEGLVTSLEEKDGGWRVILEGGALLETAKVLLAVGLVDELPDIPGLEENWGRGVHHCVFCDGYEHRGQPWGLLLEDPALIEHLPFFSGWSGNLTVFTNGCPFSGEEIGMLRKEGFGIEEAPIARIAGGASGHALEKVVLADGRAVEVTSLWIKPGQSQIRLVTDLGLELEGNGAISRDETGETSRPGIHAAGDVSAGPAQQAILAAADGARVAYGLVRQLVMEARSAP